MRRIGIHVALGAVRRVVVPLIIRQVLTPLALGITAGLVLSSDPFYLSPVDPSVYLLALATFMIAGVTAAALPALRVLRADPIGALRHE